MAHSINEISRATKVDGQSLTDLMDTVPPKYPFDYQLYRQTRPCGPLPNLPTDRTLLPLWSTYQHKALIVLALELATITESAPSDAVQCADYAGEELRRHCEEVIAVTHPQEAADLAADI